MDVRKNVLIALSAILLILPIVFSSKTFQGPMRLQSATVLPQPIALPEFLLSDQDGAIFNRRSFEGRWSLVFFGFTHCPDICPATLQQLAVVRRRLADTTRDVPEVILISVDPQRDSPEILKQYVGHFGAGITGVTGELDEIRTLTSTLHVFFEYSGGEGDNYNVNHSAVIVVINPDAEFQAVFSTPHDIDKIVSDVQVLIAGR